MTLGWEQEEWRCAVEAAERAGEDMGDDRPTRRELDLDEFLDSRDEAFDEDEYDDE